MNSKACSSTGFDSLKRLFNDLHMLESTHRDSYCFTCMAVLGIHGWFIHNPGYHCIQDQRKKLRMLDGKIKISVHKNI